jgi:phage terminase Nu1 subunit (DNA packaging protein)
MDAFDKIKEKCRKQYVSRKELWDLTGGIIKPRTVTDLDHKGIGIPNSVIIGHKRVYPIDEVIEWLRANSRLICKK